MTSQAKTILITGASGFIGGVVVEAAVARGLQVHTLSRRDWAGAPFVPVTNRFLGSLPFHIPEEALKGVDAIVHLANTTGGENDQTAHAVNVEGTRRLLKMAGNAGVQKIVYISSQSAREDAISAYGKTKLEAEQVVKKSGLPWTIMRPGLVYGAGRNDLYSRMAGVVKKFPVVPLLGSGNAAVQPIHAEDLAEAIFRCLDPNAHDEALYNLGRAKPTTLRGFLQRISIAQRGKAKPMASIPLKPIIFIVGILESMGLKGLPVNTNNLKGLEKVETMETAPSLKKLELQLRPLQDGLNEVEASRGKKKDIEDDIPLENRTLRVGLIGAGRIGMFHALTLARKHGMLLTAIIDKNKKAPGMLLGMGVKAPTYQSLSEALKAAPLDGALIATPPSAHLPITAECAGENLAIFVEKPLAHNGGELDAFRKYAADRATGVGYYAPCLKHYQDALKRLHAGEFGKLECFEAFCLQGYFPNPKKQWECRPELSGGGALINTAGHVLSMVFEAFGAPVDLKAESRKVYNENVEDAIAVEMMYKDFSGRLYGSWAIRGFPELENRIVVKTDRGTLVCNNTMAVFLGNDGEAEWLHHQLDFEVGFNMAPHYIGGGVSEELRQFEANIRNGEEPTVSIPRGCDMEDLLFKIYDKAEDRKTFKIEFPEPCEFAEAATTANDLPAKANRRVPLTLDVRSVDKISPALAGKISSRWDGVRCRANQVDALLRSGIDEGRITVVVPDFMNYARMRGSEGDAALLKSFGWGSRINFVKSALTGAAAAKGITAWVGGQALLDADLAALPRDFRGTVLTFNFLNDMAVALRQTAALNKMLNSIRKRLPRARAGVQTNILSDMMELLVYFDVTVDEVHFLSSETCSTLRPWVEQLKGSERFSGVHLSAEVNQAPAPFYGHIINEPHHWLHGADSLVVDALADPDIAKRRRQNFDKAWNETFPGLKVPPAAL